MASVKPLKEFDNCCTDRRALYEQALQCLDREENLINYRTNFGIQINAIAASFLIGLNVLHNNRTIDNILYYIFSVAIIILGIFLSYNMGRAINAAHEQVNYIITHLNYKLFPDAHIREPKDKIQSLPEEHDKITWDVSEFLRPYGEIKKVHIVASNLSRSIPYIFGVMWVISPAYLFTGLR